MTARLIRAKAGEFTGLWEEMTQAHIARSEWESARDQNQLEADNDRETKRRISRAQRLASKALYGKAAKTLAENGSLDPSSPAVRIKLKNLHPSPSVPTRAIERRDLPPKQTIDPNIVRTSLLDMGKDSAAGPDRAGVRWLLLIANIEMRVCPEF